MQYTFYIIFLWVVFILFRIACFIIFMLYLCYIVYCNVNFFFPHLCQNMVIAFKEWFWFHLLFKKNPQRILREFNHVCLPHTDICQHLNWIRLQFKSYYSGIKVSVQVTMRIFSCPGIVKSYVATLLKSLMHFYYLSPSPLNVCNLRYGTICFEY